MVALTSPFDPADAGATLMQLACTSASRARLIWALRSFSSKDTNTGVQGRVIFRLGSECYQAVVLDDSIICCYRPTLVSVPFWICNGDHGIFTSWPANSNNLRSSPTVSPVHSMSWTLSFTTRNVVILSLIVFSYYEFTG